MKKNQPGEGIARAPLFLRGKSVSLRALVPEDADGPYVEWFNDPEVTAGNSHHDRPFTRQEALDYIDRARRGDRELILAIVRTDSGGHLGNITLKRIDPINRSAEFAIVIGDKEAWGKGFSKEAGRLLLHHAFQSLNLRRIYCGTFETNVPMQRLAASLGMKEEGRRRQAAYKDGKYLDVIEYGVLREEYEAGSSSRKGGP